MAVTKTFGYVWTAEEDAVLVDFCNQNVDEDGGLHTGYLPELQRLFPHRTRASIRHRVRFQVECRRAPSTWLRKTPLQLPLWSQADTGWLAGIFDGEGSLSVRPIGKYNGRSIYLALCVNTDEAILTRVRVLAGRTIKCHLSHKGRPNAKPCYQIMVRRQADIRIILERLAPHVTHLGKRQKIVEALAYINRGSRRT